MICRRHCHRSGIGGGGGRAEKEDAVPLPAIATDGLRHHDIDVKRHYALVVVAPAAPVWILPRSPTAVTCIDSVPVGILLEIQCYFRSSEQAFAQTFALAAALSMGCKTV